MATRRKRKQRERLSERTPQGDAIVYSHGNKNREYQDEQKVPDLVYQLNK